MSKSLQFGGALLLSFCITSQGLRRGAGRANESSPALYNESLSSYMRVHKLVTYAAPRPGTAQLRNAASSDGCWDGIRFVATNWFQTDVVPCLLQETIVWSHPYMQSKKVNSNSEAWTYKCGDNGFVPSTPSIRLHSQDMYYDRLKNAPLSWERDVTRNGLRISYDGSINTVKSKLESGWVHVASDIETMDYVHLVKQTSTNRCIVTFSGTNGDFGSTENIEEWFTNLSVWPRDWCSFSYITFHRGFVDELMRIVNHQQWKNNIKPQLKSCSSITATGHSLGGALASIFAACANNEARARNNADFQAIKWW